MRLYLKLLLILYLFTSVNAKGQFQFESTKSKIVIPCQLINNLVFIPITINGEKLTFLLDTGVEQTILFSLDETNKITLFHLEEIKLKGLGVQESIVGYKSCKNKIEIKELVDTNHEIYLVLNQEFNFSSQVGIVVNGIIGHAFFKNNLVEINYKRKQVIIYNPTNNRITKRLKRKFIKDSISIEECKPYVFNNYNTEQFSKKTKMLLDTGNSGALWFFRNSSNPIKLPEKTIDDFLGRGFSGNVYGLRGRLKQYTFGNFTFENILTTYPDSTSVNTLNFVENRIGSIGSEILSRFDLVFDYPHGCYYSRPNDKIHEEFNFNKSGIEVQHDGLEWVKETYEESPSKGIKISFAEDKDERFQDNLKIKFELKPTFKIYSIRKDSPAAIAGLQVNDKILKINRRDTHSMSIEKINDLLKSEEGKTIEMEIERNSKTYMYTFQLKNII